MLSPISDASQSEVNANERKSGKKIQDSSHTLFEFFMGGKSSQKLALMVSRHGGTTVIYCLVNQAYKNWQKNKAIGQIRPITERDIEKSCHISSEELRKGLQGNLSSLLIKTMVSASNAEISTNYLNLPALLSAIQRLDPADRICVLDAIEREPSISEITDLAKTNGYKAEVYLSAYLAIRVDSQIERAFLNNLAISLALPRGLPAYLEQQADQGIKD